MSSETRVNRNPKATGVFRTCSDISVVQRSQRHSFSRDAYNKIVQCSGYGGTNDGCVGMRNDRTTGVSNMEATNRVECVESVRVQTPRRCDIVVSSRDRLFWYLMLLVNDWDVDDLPIPSERFAFESNEKTKAVELLQKSSDIPWKELKLGKTEICTNLACGSARPLSLDEFIALCYLYEVNVIYTWGKCYTKINGNRNTVAIDWSVIRKTRSGEVLVDEKEAASVAEKVMRECFQVKDCHKPLGPITSYKLGDLQEVCKVFDINTSYDSGKTKQKRILYDEITVATQKID